MSTNQAAEGDTARPRKPWLTRTSAFVSVVLLGLLIVLIWNIAGQRRATGGMAASRGGPSASPAPDFDIPLYGSDVHFRLSDHRGQGVVINFWASWCHPCREEMPVLEEGWRTYKDRGIAFIGANVSDSEEKAAAFLREIGVTYPNGPDPGGEVSALYHLSGLPETFFVTPDGVVAQRVIGGVTAEGLSEAVDAILPKSK
jgi:cytochrome c biogenesis protein CcmG/thiol:disulfide interchange protein DsbE